MSGRIIPETNVRADWPRLVAQAHKDHETRVSNLEADAAGRQAGFYTTGQNVISANRALGDTDKGSHLLIVTPGVTITFPASGFASGEGVLVANVSGGAATFAFPGGSDMGATFPTGASIACLCDGGGFWRQYFYSTARL